MAGTGEEARGTWWGTMSERGKLSTWDQFWKDFRFYLE